MFDIFKNLKGVDSKRIILPILVILLCFISVVGSTYALFTSGDDGKIGINSASGYIKMDIVDINNNSLLDDELDFIVTTADNKPYYFEPGATVHTQGFKILNKGNITVNYRAYISDDPNEDMEAFNRAFEVWISDDPDNLANATNITEFKGTLGPEEMTTTYYLVVKMKESANNDFQGEMYSGIGITVYAVQGNVTIQ